jgi:outer membrane immunogenic protein
MPREIVGTSIMTTSLSASVAGLAAVLTIPIAAAAADLSVKPQPAPITSAPFSYYNWTGFYLGGNLGGAWANGSVSDSLFGVSDSTGHSGFIGGGQLGFNYQISNLVLGIEGDVDWTSLSATGSGVLNPGGATLQASANTNWVSTLAGRFGVAFDQMLVYGKAGGGWTGNTATITNLTSAASASASNINSGWLVGAGVEWAFWSNWSTKIEYNYLGLRSWTFASAVFPADTFTVNRNIQMVKVGVNYKFDWGSPITTRY